MNNGRFAYYPEIPPLEWPEPETPESEVNKQLFGHHLWRAEALVRQTFCQPYEMRTQLRTTWCDLMRDRTDVSLKQEFFETEYHSVTADQERDRQVRILSGTLSALHRLQKIRVTKPWDVCESPYQRRRFATDIVTDFRVNPYSPWDVVHNVTIEEVEMALWRVKEIEKAYLPLAGFTHWGEGYAAHAVDMIKRVIWTRWEPQRTDAHMHEVIGRITARGVHDFLGSYRFHVAHLDDAEYMEMATEPSIEERIQDQLDGWSEAFGDYTSFLTRTILKYFHYLSLRHGNVHGERIREEERILTPAELQRWYINEGRVDSQGILAALNPELVTQLAVQGWDVEHLLSLAMQRLWPEAPAVIDEAMIEQLQEHLNSCLTFRTEVQQTVPIRDAFRRRAELFSLAQLVQLAASLEDPLRGVLLHSMGYLVDYRNDLSSAPWLLSEVCQKLSITKHQYYAGIKTLCSVLDAIRDGRFSIPPVELARVSIPTMEGEIKETYFERKSVENRFLKQPRMAYDAAVLTGV